MLTIFRAAFFKTEDYKKVISELKEQMNMIQIGQTESIRNSWAELKKRGG